MAMKLNLLVLTGAVSVGIALGAIGHAFHGSAQTPVAVAELVKRDLASGGKGRHLFGRTSAGRGRRAALPSWGTRSLTS